MGAALGMAAVVLPAPVRDYLEKQHMPLPSAERNSTRHVHDL